MCERVPSAGQEMQVSKGSPDLRRLSSEAWAGGAEEGPESDPWVEGCGWDPCATHHAAREAAAGLEWGLLRSGGLQFSDERPDIDT